MAAERVHTFLMQRQSGKPQRIIVWDTHDISVGRAPENDVVIEDAEASRNHAQFRRGENGHLVHNMSVSNPTYVNDESVTTRPLRNKDVVRIAETDFVFYQVTRNPVTLGIPVEYASQLKDFGPKIASGDGEATILGLVDPVSSDGDEDFVVRPARDFDHELAGMEMPELPRTPRNLDDELADDGLEDLELPGDADAAGASDTLALTLEIQGLTGAQRTSLEGLLGKLIELPRLRIRIKGRDLD